MIPYSANPSMNYFKHVGLYAFSRRSLKKIKELDDGILEKEERLEQLRWLEHACSIGVIETRGDIIGIDTEEELAYAQTKIFTM